MKESLTRVFSVIHDVRCVSVVISSHLAEVIGNVISHWIVARIFIILFKNNY